MKLSELAAVARKDRKPRDLDVFYAVLLVAVHSHFRTQWRVLRSWLRSSPGWPSMAELVVVFRQASGSRRLERALDTYWRRAALRGGASAAADIGLASLSRDDPELSRWLHRRGHAQVATIDATTLNRVTTRYRQVAAAGASRTALEGELGALYAGFETAEERASRSMIIAISEIGLAYELGRRLIRSRATAPLVKRWVTVGDAAVCPICSGAASDGWIIEDTEFSIGGDAPPGHSMCRCDLELAQES